MARFALDRGQSGDCRLGRKFHTSAVAGMKTPTVTLHRRCPLAWLPPQAPALPAAFEQPSQELPRAQQAPRREGERRIEVPFGDAKVQRKTLRRQKTQSSAGKLLWHSIEPPATRAGTMP